MDPRAEQVLRQQRQLNRQANAFACGDEIDDVEIMQSQAIRDTVTELDDDMIHREVMKMYHSMDFLDLLDFVKGVFRGSSKGEFGTRPRKFETRRRTLFLDLLHLLMQSHLAQSKNHTAFCSNLVSLLQREIDTLDITSVPCLIENILLGIEQAYRDQEEIACVIPMPLPSVDLLPHLYGRMLCFASTTIPSHTQSTWEFDEESNWTGLKYVERSLDRLLRARWPLRLLTQMVHVLRDVAWTSEQHAAICTKFLAQLTIEMTPVDAETQPDFAVLPGLFHHLLVFVRDHSKDLKKSVLQSLVEHFDLLSVEATKPKHHRATSNVPQIVFGATELRAFQATILYQLDKLIAQDSTLGSVLLEMIMPFRLTLSWKSTHFALLLLLRTHTKFTTTVDKSCLEYYTQLIKTSSDGVNLLLDVLAAFERGQMETLLASAVSLGFSLFSSSNREVLQVGIKVISYAFRHHSCVRLDILEQIVHWCLSTSTMTETPANLPHIKLLGSLLHQSVMDLDAVFLDRLRDLLEYLPGFTVAIAHAILRTLAPVLRHKVHLRNALVLTLRKAMFRREETFRVIAIYGFSTILDCVLQATSGNAVKPMYLTQMNLPNSTSTRVASSQSLTQRAFVSQSQSMMEMDAMEFDAGHLPSVFRQFAGMFRRAMTCQKSVKAVLYIELKELVKRCPDLIPSVEELVWPALSSLIESNVAMTPALSLKPDEATPLLLDLMITCAPAKVEIVMERLLHVELQDYELDLQAIAADPTTRTTATGIANINRAKDLLILCDVILNYIWGKDDGMRSSRLSPDQLEKTLKLVRLRDNVLEYINPSAVTTSAQTTTGKKRGPKGKKNDTLKAKAKPVPASAPEKGKVVENPHCVIHPRNILMALETLFGQTNHTHHYALQRCILEITQGLIAEWTQLAKSSWLEVKPLLIFRMSVRTQKDYLSQLSVLLWAAADTGLSPTNEKTSLATLAYRILITVLDITPDLSKQLGTVEQMQKKIFAFLRESHEPEAELVLQMLIKHWYPQLPTRQNAWKWMEAICIGQTLQSLPLVTLLCRTLLTEPTYRSRISMALLLYLEESDEESNDRVRYACITPNTVVPVAGVFLDCFEKSCNAHEHTFKTVKSISEDQLDKLIDELTELCQIIAPLITVSFPHSPTTLRLFRMLLRLFKLHTLAIQAKVKNKVTEVSSSLKHFLDATSRELAPLVLNFVACHHEENKRKALKQPKKKMPAQEAKLIPDVIFQVEQFDVGIIKLSKRCKSTNFKRWCIRRQARDFRINQDKVQSLIGEQDSADEAHEASASEQEEEEEEDEAKVDTIDLQENNSEDENQDEEEDCPATARQDSDEEVQSRHIKRRRVLND
ncbi:hypothetical protein THRCLA_02780 [Thraustotheca clavata]|uniref:Uncharacterized protein n=1 Tax=Thraustotheca clavata TaxID=74557 RepID=A0A1W0A4B6_9STRA|nr:hypothetical protein THRCLA_02780 [Thraustotheca clavata]